MLNQDVGDSLFLVLREPGEGYYVEERVVWGRKDTGTDFGDRSYLVLVYPGDEYEPDPEDPVVFRHGHAGSEFFAAFEDADLAHSTCEYLNGY